MTEETHIIHGSDMDLCAFDNLASGWPINFIQFGNGVFNSTLTQVITRKFHLAHVYFNSKVKQEGLSVPGFWSFAFVNDTPLTWRNFKIQPKSILVYESNSEINAISDSGFDVVIFSISEEEFNARAEGLGIRNLAEKLRNHPVLSPDSREWDDLRCLIANEIDASLDKKETSEMFMEAFLKRLLPALQNAEAAIVKVSGQKRKALVTRAEQYIQGNLSYSITVNEIAKHCGVSERTLLYAIHQRFGVGTNDFIKILRLNYVYRMLHELPDGQTIADTSRYFGFWHMGQFHKDFKEFFGVLPSEIRA